MVCIERGLHLPLEFLLSCLFELCGICVVLYGRTACRSRYVDTFDLDTWTLQTCIFPPSQAEIRPCFVRVRLKHGRAPSAPAPARVAALAPAPARVAAPGQRFPIPKGSLLAIAMQQHANLVVCMRTLVVFDFVLLLDYPVDLQVPSFV